MSRVGNGRRTAIVEVAADLFGRMGYRGASLRDIAAEVGISHPGLLYHFGTKEALLQAVLEETSELQWWAPQFDEAPDAASKLALMVDLLRFQMGRPAIAQLFLTLAAEATEPSHPAHEYFQERYATLTAALRTVVTGLDNEGRLVGDGVDADAVARQLIGTFEGLLMQSLYVGDDMDLLAIMQDCVDSLVAEPPRLA